MKNLFESARTKLTFWYVFIIMIVSLSFSGLIFRGVTQEFQRRFNIIEKRFAKITPQGWRVGGPVHDYFLEDLQIARKQILFTIIYANGAIFILSAAVGYHLAGKSLRPIEEAMEEQKRFIADASHELKTPLTALHTSIEVALRDKKLNLTDAKQALKESLADVKSLTQLSNNLLTLARFQQNGTELHYKKVDIKKIITSAHSKVKPIAKKNGIQVVLKTTSSKLKADQDNLEKLMTILLDNAIKYSKKGGKVIVTAKESGKYIIIKVKDSGLGIGKKELAKIFDRFYRADSSRTKRKVDGFGLGLSMAKKIVELHRGTINVVSKLGKGSEFTVKLPII